MPYIKEDRRDKLERNLNRSKDSDSPWKSGELNFCIMNIITDYLIYKPVNYSTINEVIGVLECVKQEVYRRVAIPYENKKIIDNGDLWQFGIITKDIEND